MSTCVKTGADCYVNEWKATVRCDVHKFKDAVIVSFNPESFSYDTKHVDLQVTIGDGYFNKGDGIIVVKMAQVTTNNDILRARLFNE